MIDPQSTFEMIRKRPAMFCGEHTLSALNHFIAGYSWALETHGVQNPNDPLVIPREFHAWVAYRLHFQESTSGWCNMIKECTNSDVEAFDRFFQLLEEFRVRVPHVVAKLIGIQKQYQRTCGDVTETLQFPDSISLVTYTEDPGFFVLTDSEDDLPIPDFFPCIDWFETFIGAKRTQLTIVDPNWNFGIQKPS